MHVLYAYRRPHTYVHSRAHTHALSSVVCSECNKVKCPISIGSISFILSFSFIFGRSAVLYAAFEQQSIRNSISAI